MDKFTSGGPAFMMHVPCHPRGTDPSRNDKAFNQPSPIRETATQAWVKRGGGRGLNGQMVGAATGATAVITCTQANVEVGKHIVRVDEYDLSVGIDFAIGADDDALATNLAAAIDNLPALTAVAALNVVTILTTSGNGDDVIMDVIEFSAASAFALTALDRAGFLDRGAPAPGAPTIA